MKKIKLLIALLAFCLGAMAQPLPVVVECTEGEYPEEISWEILNCSGDILLSGGAPFTGAVLIPNEYEIHMHDNYGDGWNGAYLYVDVDSFGFLSDVDWIATIGTWPQIYTDTIVDVGCLTLGTGTGSVIDDPLEPVEYIFEPTEYFDLSGRKVTPDASGIYIASDGYIRKLIYITKK